MKKALSFMIILILLFSISTPLSAEKLPDGRVIPDEVEYYSNILIDDDDVYPGYKYAPGTTTAKTLDPELRFYLVAWKFMDPVDEAWQALYLNCDKISYDYGKLISSDKDLGEVEVYVLPIDLVQERYRLVFGDEAEPELEFFRTNTAAMQIYKYEIIDGKEVYLYYFTEPNGGGDSAKMTRKDIYDYEYVDNKLLIYINYFAGYSDIDNVDSEVAKVWLYADTACTVPTVTLPWTEYFEGDRNNPEYYGQYLHTFKSNGEGRYYWYSTELIGVGGKPVDEVIPSTDDTAIIYPILVVCSMLVIGGVLVMRKRTKA